MLTKKPKLHAELQNPSEKWMTLDEQSSCGLWTAVFFFCRIETSYHKSLMM